MNQTTVIVGGIIIIVGIAAYVFLSSERAGSFFTNATSTVATTTPPGPVPPPSTQTPRAPGVTTNPGGSTSDTTAVVSGRVTPNGPMTTYWFEYGTTTNLGNKTSNQNVGSGFVSTLAPGYITGLAKETTYYFRLVAENQYGRIAGAQSTFRTAQGNPPPVGGVPTAKTLAASGITRTTANLKGEVMPNKATAQYWFEYGGSANLGQTTALVAVGDGSAIVTASAPVTGLSANATYYYRLNAQNQFGTVSGTILTFKTLPPVAATAPEAVTRPATTISTTAAHLRGTVDPNGAETSYWFEYSTNALFNVPLLLQTTPKRSAGAGTSAVAVEADATGLSPNTTYYFRVVAQNSVGIDRSTRDSFKTK